MIASRLRALALAAALLPVGVRAAAVCDALCAAKIRAFEVYMEQIDTGRAKYPLPAVYRDVLRPHYPNVDLSEIRFAFSDQQPPDNATTDCNHIYFNSEPYVAALRDAAPNPKLVWLLHELVHPEQCAAAGGRAGYAKRWWDELESAVRESGETIDVFQTTEQIVKQLQALYLRVHDAMPMEQAADAKAKAVIADLEACCIAEDGTLRPPLSATPSSPSRPADAAASRPAWEDPP